MAGKSRTSREDVAKKLRQLKVKSAMRETHENVPSTVTRANVSPERKEKMKQAIAFDKVRDAERKARRKK